MTRRNGKGRRQPQSKVLKEEMLNASSSHHEDQDDYQITGEHGSPQNESSVGNSDKHPAHATPAVRSEDSVSALHENSMIKHYPLAQNSQQHDPTSRPAPVQHTHKDETSATYSSSRCQNNADSKYPCSNVSASIHHRDQVDRFSQTNQQTSSPPGYHHGYMYHSAADYKQGTSIPSAYGHHGYMYYSAANYMQGASTPPAYHPGYMYHGAADYMQGISITPVYHPGYMYHSTADYMQGTSTLPGYHYGNMYSSAADGQDFNAPLGGANNRCDQLKSGTSFPKGCGRGRDFRSRPDNVPRTRHVHQQTSPHYSQIASVHARITPSTTIHYINETLENANKSFSETETPTEVSAVTNKAKKLKHDAAELQAKFNDEYDKELKLKAQQLIQKTSDMENKFSAALKKTVESTITTSPDLKNNNICSDTFMESLQRPQQVQKSEMPVRLDLSPPGLQHEIGKVRARQGKASEVKNATQLQCQDSQESNKQSAIVKESCSVLGKIVKYVQDIVAPASSECPSEMLKQDIVSELNRYRESRKGSGENSYKTQYCEATGKYETYKNEVINSRQKLNSAKEENLKKNESQTTKKNKPEIVKKNDPEPTKCIPEHCKGTGAIKKNSLYHTENAELTLVDKVVSKLETGKNALDGENKKYSSQLSSKRDIVSALNSFKESRKCSGENSYGTPYCKATGNHETYEMEVLNIQRELNSAKEETLKKSESQIAKKNEPVIAKKNKHKPTKCTPEDSALNTKESSKSSGENSYKTQYSEATGNHETHKMEVLNIQKKLNSAKEETLKKSESQTAKKNEPEIAKKNDPKPTKCTPEDNKGKGTVKKNPAENAHLTSVSKVTSKVETGKNTLDGENNKRCSSQECPMQTKKMKESEKTVVTTPDTKHIQQEKERDKPLNQHTRPKNDLETSFVSSNETPENISKEAENMTDEDLKDNSISSNNYETDVLISNLLGQDPDFSGDLSQLLLDYQNKFIHLVRNAEDLHATVKSFFGPMSKVKFIQDSIKCGLKELEEFSTFNLSPYKEKIEKAIKNLSSSNMVLENRIPMIEAQEMPSGAKQQEKVPIAELPSSPEYQKTQPIAMDALRLFRQVCCQDKWTRGKVRVLGQQLVGCQTRLDDIVIKPEDEKAVNARKDVLNLCNTALNKLQALENS